MASLFVDVQPSKAKITLFGDSDRFLIASKVGACSLRQMLLRVIADRSTKSSRNVLYDVLSTTFDIAFHGISTEPNPDIR